MASPGKTIYFRTFGQRFPASHAKSWAVMVSHAKSGEFRGQRGGGVHSHAQLCSLNKIFFKKFPFLYFKFFFRFCKSVNGNCNGNSNGNGNSYGNGNGYCNGSGYYSGNGNDNGYCDGNGYYTLDLQNSNVILHIN